MAAVAATSCAAAATTFLLPKKSTVSTSHGVSVKPVNCLPRLRMSRLVCSAKKDSSEEVQGLPKLAAAVTSAATFAVAHPAFALVDERLGTEGTGLGLGLSNSKLTWILVGVSSFIWALYFVYASKLPESDDDSGLSL